MRQVFQYLAFVALCCAALLSSCQRPEIPEPETLPSQLAVNFSIGFDASDTKAIKTAWETGDVVFIFFNGITTNGSGAAKYLKLTWNSSNSSWTSTPMNGLTASDLAASPAKALTAVYLPFSGNAAVNYDATDGFTFDPSPSSLFWYSAPAAYVLEASATDVNTTVLSLVDVGDHLTMAVPDGFIQFFLDDANATASAAGDYFLKVPGVTATGLAGVSSTGGISLSSNGDYLPAFVYDKQNKASGESKGYLFSGVLDQNLWGKNTSRRMVCKTSSGKYMKMSAQTSFHQSKTSGRAFKIPALDTWTPMPYVDGAFSVSSSKKVAFAKGNVVVEYTNVNDENHREWKIAPEQYSIFADKVTQTVPVVPAGQKIIIDHFRWATAGVKNPDGNYGADPGHIRYMPNSCEYIPLSWGSPDHESLNWNPTVSNLYNIYGIGPSGNSVDGWSVYGIPYQGYNYSGDYYETEEDDTWLNYWEVMRYCDWGVHFDAAGTGYDTPPDNWAGWHTLSMAEWKYVLKRRDDAQLKYGIAGIWDDEKGMYIYGAVLLPDEFTLPAGCAFTPGKAGSVSAGWQDLIKNHYYTGDSSKGASGSWRVMEDHGAVFLPFSGLGTIGGTGEYGNAAFDNWETGLWGYEYYASNGWAPDGLYWSSSAARNSAYQDENDENATDYKEVSIWAAALDIKTDYYPTIISSTTSRTFFANVRLAIEVN